MLAKEVLKEFKFECQIRKFSPRTIKGYINNNMLFFNFCEKEFGISELSSIKSTHIKAYIQFLMQKQLSETYINGLIKCFRAYFKFCCNEGYISENPSFKVGWQKEPKVIINTFTDEEVAKLLSVQGDTPFLTARNRAILALFFDTGVRCLELCNLENKDIKDTYINIRDGKGSKERNVGKSPKLEKYLIRYERIREHYIKDKIIKCDNYFISRTGRQLTVTGVEKILEIAGEKARVRQDIRCSPHTCRHYHAQAQLRNGLDVYSLSRLLGHESISITKRYLQSLQDRDIVQLSVKTSPLMNL